ncbi:MAG: sugar phosphate isomerase/epimerase [Clostridia bacterium]|nr:sugar phosphate isomerase/epimerase [Clostridia bacterium]
MKLGVLTVPLGDMNLEEVLAYLSGLGVQTVELGAGGFPGKAHLDPDRLLDNPSEIQHIKDLLDKYHMEISAVSCHGNPVHPQKEVAQSFHEQFEKAVLVAEQLGVDTVVGFSGCPGDCPQSQYPNWVVAPWPDDALKILDYQWNDVLIPYWTKMASFVKDHGVNKIAFELHPNFSVYNPETLLKLRAAVGDCIGANFDPSHLVWQGIDIPAALRALKGAIYHFHAKDTKIDPINTAVNGVLDTKHFGNELERSWIFRTVGYGHDIGFWKDIVSTLRMIGYDGALSIEHEDSLMTGKEGLEKAIAFLKDILIFEGVGEMFWA